MYAPTKSLSAKTSQRILLGIIMASLISLDIQIPTDTSAAAITGGTSSSQTDSSLTKPLSPTAKSSSTGSRKSHRLVRRPALSNNGEAGAITTATLSQPPLTPAINPLPAKTASPEPVSPSTRERAQEKQSPPISFAAPIAGPLAPMSTAPIALTAAPSALMGNAQLSTRVAAAAPSGTSSPRLPGGMQRLLSELPGATQIVAYQEKAPNQTVVPPPTTTPAPPAIGVTPGSLTFTAQEGGGNPTPQSLALSNTGGGTLSWTVSNSATWLSHTPTAGTGNGVVTISPATGSLAAGTYNGSVTLYATGATPINVPITLTITSAPQPTTGSVTLSWSPNSESDLAGYKVYRATSSGGYGAPLATVTTGTTQYVASGLPKGATYFFVITAYDKAGNESAYSGEVSKSIY